MKLTMHSVSTFLLHSVAYIGLLPTTMVATSPNLETVKTSVDWLAYRLN